MEGDGAADETYLKELREAENADLSLVRNKQIVVVAKTEDGSLARDSDRAPAVIVTPALVPQENSNAWEQAFQLFMLETKEVCESSYRVIYIHSGFSGAWWMSWWLLSLRLRLSRGHRKNLCGLTIVHPSVWVRLLFLGMRPVLGAGFWKKLHYVDRIEELWLDEMMEEGVARRNIPQAVFGYEQKIVEEAEESRNLAIALGAPLAARERQYQQGGHE